MEEGIKASDFDLQNVKKPRGGIKNCRTTKESSSSVGKGLQLKKIIEC